MFSVPLVVWSTSPFFFFSPFFSLFFFFFFSFRGPVPLALCGLSVRHTLRPLLLLLLLLRQNVEEVYEEFNDVTDDSGASKIGISIGYIEV